MVNTKMVFYVIPPGKLPKLRDTISKFAKKPSIRNISRTVYFSADDAAYAYTTAASAERHAKRLQKIAKYMLV